MGPSWASSHASKYSRNSRLNLVLPLLALSAVSTESLDNGVARTPPLGWSSWNAYHCQISEHTFLQQAEVLVSSGLKAAGYTLVSVDDCWQAELCSNASTNPTLHGVNQVSTRDPCGRDPQTGEILVNKKTFPSGMDGLGRRLRQMGLQFGVYSSASSVTCSGFPGSLFHEDVDAKTFARWGAAWLKYDCCSEYDISTMARFSAMRDALNRTGVPIMFDADGLTWLQADRRWMDIGNFYGAWMDIAPNFEDIMLNIDNGDRWSEWAGPGAYINADTMEIGNGMNAGEERAHFALWALVKSPLILDTDLRKLSKAQLALVSNPEIIAISQARPNSQARSVQAPCEPTERVNIAGSARRSIRTPSGGWAGR
jgi:alpha-galactosidase